MPTTTMARVRTIVTGVAGSPYYITGYFEYLEDDDDAYGQAWHAFTAPGGGALPQGAIYTTEAEMALVDPISGDQVGSRPTAGNSTAGTNIGDYLPPTNQLLVRWRTGVFANGREIRGRTFLPCQNESNSGRTGNPTPDHVAAQQALANTLVNQLVPDLVVWSKKNGRWERVTSASVWNQFAVLRSRRD